MAKRIRALREQKRPLIWRAICEKLNIHTQDGRIDPGLAYRIAYQDYEPMSRAVRQRLGLKDICPRCKRTYRAARAVPRTSIPEAVEWWRKLTKEERERIYKDNCG